MEQHILRQIFVMISLVIQGVACGFALGYPTILLAALSQQTTEIVIDQDSSSTIVAIRGIGIMINSILIYIVMQKYGRKSTQLFCVIPGILGWTLCYFSQNVYHLMIMHTLLGLQMGGALSTLSIVVGEYSSPNNRGMFLIVNTAFFFSGTGIVHTLGVYLYWRTVALVALVLNVLYVISARFWPESPYWLASVGRFEDSVKSFHYIRGKADEDLMELNDLLMKHKERLEIEGKDRNILVTIRNNVLYMKNIDFWKPVFAMVMLNNLVELSGRFVLMTYSISMLKEITGSEGLAYQLTIITDALCLIASFIATYLVKIVNRRSLLFYTISVCSICLASCSLLLYLMTNGVVPSSYCIWIVVTFYLIFISGMNLGVCPVSMAYFGEIFPVIYKPVAGIVISIYGVFLNTILGKTVPYLMSSARPHGTFLTFAICTVVCTVYLFRYLPETKDKTLQEIENYWEDGCGKLRKPSAAVGEEECLNKEPYV